MLQLHNKIEDLKGKIRVYVRVRPFSQKERDRGCKEAVEAQGKQSIAVQDPRVSEDKNFEFDQVGRCLGVLYYRACVLMRNIAFESHALHVSRRWFRRHGLKASAVIPQLDALDQCVDLSGEDSLRQQTLIDD